MMDLWKQRVDHLSGESKAAPCRRSGVASVKCELLVIVQPNQCPLFMVMMVG